MDVIEVIDKVRDEAAVDRVFGHPITQDGVTVIPVARIAGGGGGGTGKQEGERAGEGTGGGFGLGATPLGLVVIKDGDVHWQPILDINRLAPGCQAVAITAFLTIRTLARLPAKGGGRR